jgi:hypothetical protein
MRAARRRIASAARARGARRYLRALPAPQRAAALARWAAIRAAAGQAHAPQ